MEAFLYHRLWDDEPQCAEMQVAGQHRQESESGSTSSLAGCCRKCAVEA